IADPSPKSEVRSLKPVGLRVSTRLWSRRPDDRRGLAYAAALLAMIGWGSLFPATKPALREVTPLMIAFARALLAFVILSAISCVRSGGLAPGLRHLRRQGAAAGRGGVILGVLSFAGTTMLA